MVEIFVEMVWQQDGCSSHRAKRVITYLDEIFGNRLLAFKSKNGVSWAPHSCDLNPLDFFLWPYLISLVYKPMPKTVNELISKIYGVCYELRKNPDLIIKAVTVMKSRSKKVLERNGKAV